MSSQMPISELVVRLLTGSAHQLQIVIILKKFKDFVLIKKLHFKVILRFNGTLFMAYSMKQFTVEESTIQSILTCLSLT